MHDNASPDIMYVTDFLSQHVEEHKARAFIATGQRKEGYLRGTIVQGLFWRLIGYMHGEYEGDLNEGKQTSRSRT